MDATADAMDVTESIPAADQSHNDQNEQCDDITNEEAMKQLSLAPGEVPASAPSPAYNESPSTNRDSSLTPEDGVVDKEKETEDDADSPNPKSREPTASLQEGEPDPLDRLLLLANASVTLATEMNTNETNVDTEMEEDTPAVTAATETLNNPPVVTPSNEPTTVNQASIPEITAMDEDARDEEEAAAAPKPTTTVAKYVPPPVVDDAEGWGISDSINASDKGKEKSKDADGLGDSAVAAAGKSTTGTNSDGWGVNDATPGWGTGGGDSNSSSTLRPWVGNGDAGVTNGNSGFGNRGGGGLGNRGRDRESHGNRDRDRGQDRNTYEDRDGLRRQRPSSFGNGFGSGGPPFASGSNAELLPPLGRSPVKNQYSDRQARLARSAPYPPRRETRSDDWGNGGLDYGGPGDNNDVFGAVRGGAGGGGGSSDGAIVVSHKPVVLNEMDIGGLDTLSNMMNNADIKKITNSIMDHIGQIQKLRNSNIDAHNLVRQCGHLYSERKAELHASLVALSSPEDAGKKAAILLKLEAHRLKGKVEENFLESSVLNTETALKREVNALIHTISEAMADKIHACVLDTVRAISTGNGTGSSCDVEKVVEKCVMLATPKLVKDQLGAQEKLIRGLDRRVGQLDELLQERDKTIVDLDTRLKRLERKLERGHDMMVTDTTNPSTSTTMTSTNDGDSDSPSAPDPQPSSSSNCVHQ